MNPLYLAVLLAACSTAPAAPLPAAELALAADMAEAARRFLTSLTPAQGKRARIALDDPERTNWHYVPRGRALPAAARSAGGRLPAAGGAASEAAQGARAMRLAIVAVVAACGTPASRGGPNAELHGPWSAPAEPFRVVGNIHYVGAQRIASYLVTTPAGHVLIDTGTREMIPVVRRNIERLGFSIGDVKILLSSHAHYDHVGGHAAMKRASGARVMVMRGDADAVAAGLDRSPLGDEGWEPVAVDRVLEDGDEVALGGTTLHAIRAPGHTPGCTVWTMRAQDDRAYDVVFYGCMRPNSGVALVGNRRFPDLIAETRATFRRMRGLAPELYLTMHEDRLAGLASTARPHPLANRAAWPALLDEVEAEFEALVSASSGRASPSGG